MLSGVGDVNCGDVGSTDSSTIAAGLWDKQDVGIAQTLLQFVSMDNEIFTSC